jgi:hypothetical protein
MRTTSVAANINSQNAPVMLPIPQAELPVPSSIAVPIGQWHHPSLQPGSLHDVTRKRWLRHVAVVRSSRFGALCRVSVLSSLRCDGQNRSLIDCLTVQSKSSKSSAHVILEQKLLSFLQLITELSKTYGIARGCSSSIIIKIGK